MDKLQKSVIESLKVLEIVVNLVSYLVITFAFYFLHKSKLFHPNMIRLFKCLLFYYLISQFMRFVIAVKELEYASVIDSTDISNNYLVVSGLPQTRVYGQIRAGCIIAVFVTVGTIIIERVVATKQLETYEKNESLVFFGFCLGYQVFNALITIFIINYGAINLKMLGIWLIFNNIAGYCALCVIHWFNRKRYCTSLVNLEKYTLSERFQLQENIRASSGIKRVAAIKFLSNFVMGTAILAAEYYTTDFSKNLAYLILNHSINFYAFTFLFIGFKPNSKMLPRCLRNLKKIQRQVSISALSQTTNQQRTDLSKRIRDINGKKMVFTVEEERNLYFEQLQNGWN